MLIIIILIINKKIEKEFRKHENKNKSYHFDKHINVWTGKSPNLH